MELPFVGETVNAFVSGFLSIFATGITRHDPKLQRGLNIADKAQRVSNFQDQIEYEVGIIAHSCGVREPRELRRFHCRVMQENGLSVPLDELHPDYLPAEPHPA